MKRWLIFGRSTRDDFAGESTAYWWPLYVDETHRAKNATNMVQRIEERLQRNGEDYWCEIAVVSAAEWFPFASNQETKEGE